MQLSIVRPRRFHSDAGRSERNGLPLMASQQGTVDYVIEQLQRAGRVSARKMFGEYAIYCDGKTVALICDDQLYVKPTAAGRAFLGEPQDGFPYPGAKPHFLIAGDRWDDAEWLSTLVALTAAELPIPKPKPARKPKK